MIEKKLKQYWKVIVASIVICLASVLMVIPTVKAATTVNLEVVRTSGTVGQVQVYGDFTVGSQMQFVAPLPVRGWVWLSWQMDGVTLSTNTTYTRTIQSSDDGKILQATYGKLASGSIDLYLVSDFGGTDAILYDKLIVPGNSVTFTASSGAFGFDFKGWRFDGTIVSTNATYTRTILSTDNGKILQAMYGFDDNVFMIFINPPNTQWYGTMAVGQSITVTAPVVTDKFFVAWEFNGVEVSLNPVYT